MWSGSTVYVLHQLFTVTCVHYCGVQGSNRSLAEILREKLIVPDQQFSSIPDDLEGDQSILDDHVSRIWTDKTPLRSPGDPQGRPRSPGYSRRGGPGARVASVGQPGGLAGSRPGPVLAPPRRQQQVVAGRRYHQDLAYYEVSTEPVRGAGPQQQQQAGPGVNDRVREWMLDVERQSGGGSVDQRSQSSKGAVKTSPRSVAVTNCVLSPSQL